MSKRIATVALTALLIAGCAGSSTSSTAPPNPSTTPAATVAPTPTPLDVAAAFKTAYAAIDSGILTMTGQVTVGAVRVSMAVTSTVSGPDSDDTTTTTIAGKITSVQRIRVGGSRYVKTGTGPWLADTSKESDSQLGPELSRLAKLVTDAGVEQRGSTTVHRLTTPPGATLDPKFFGITGATNVAGTVTFFALPDGTPSAVTIQLTWQQPGGTGTVSGELSMDIAFSQLGVKHFIKAPDHVWPVFASKANGYAMAYPDDFSTTTIDTIDYFDSTTGAYVGVGRDTTGSSTLNSIVSAEIALIKKNYKTSTVKNDAASLAGVQARFLTATGTHPSLKTKVVLYEAIAVKGKFVYFVFWTGSPETATADLVTFRQMLSTFALI